MSYFRNKPVSTDFNPFAVMLSMVGLSKNWRAAFFMGSFKCCMFWLRCYARLSMFYLLFRDLIAVVIKYFIVYFCGDST